jgi:hypothetical protein
VPPMRWKGLGVRWLIVAGFWWGFALVAGLKLYDLLTWACGGA